MIIKKKEDEKNKKIEEYKDCIIFACFECEHCVDTLLKISLKIRS
jgi:hypothetical protein